MPLRGASRTACAPNRACALLPGESSSPAYTGELRLCVGGRGSGPSGGAGGPAACGRPQWRGSPRSSACARARARAIDGHGRRPDREGWPLRADVPRAGRPRRPDDRHQAHPAGRGPEAQRERPKANPEEGRASARNTAICRQRRSTSALPPGEPTEAAAAALRWSSRGARRSRPTALDRRASRTGQAAPARARARPSRGT